MKKENIIYKKNGDVDVEASIAAELVEVEKGNEAIADINEKLTKLNELKVELENSDMPNVTESCKELLTDLNEECDGIWVIYDGHLQNRKLNIFEGMRSAGDYSRVNELMLNLFCYFEDGNNYIAKITTKNGKEIYSNNLKYADNPVEVYETQIKPLGKFAAEFYLRCVINKLDYLKTFEECYMEYTQLLLDNVVVRINDGKDLVYSQKKNEFIEYLLRFATEPDFSEDEYNIRITYEKAIEVLKMINSETSVKDIVAYMNELDKSYVIDMSGVDGMALRFGKEKGIQVYEERVLKPAIAKGETEIGYSDYHGPKIEKIKALIDQIRAENAIYEQAGPSGSGLN